MMGFQKFLDQAWMDHGNQTQKVVGQFAGGLGLVEKSSDVVALGHLITHVMGEHLGDWSNGRAWLSQLSENPHAKNPESLQALARFDAVLTLAGGGEVQVSKFTPSEWARVLAMSASCVNERKESARAVGFLREAVRVATGLSDTDPAYRNLAMTGNNVAASLEERPDRSDLENELMLLAAETGRTYWEKAGTWLEVERAEYRLAQTCLKLGDADRALKHAKAGLTICVANGAPALELFFTHEVLFLAYRMGGDIEMAEYSRKSLVQEFENLEAGDKEWCVKTRDAVLAMKL